MADKEGTDKGVAAQCVEQTPEIMADLMRQFIQRRDLNSRARVRLRMKAILDFVSADTEYPNVPALNPEQEDEEQPGVPRPPRAHYRVRMPVQNMGIGQPGQQLANPAQPGEIRPVPGAARAGENADIL